MSEVIIRPYCPGDLGSCRALWVELVRHHRAIYEDPTIGGDDPGLHFDRHLARVGPEHLWVAECRGQVVGLVGLILGQEGEAEAEVEPVVVAPAYRGRGIGRLLVERVIAEARAQGAHLLTIVPAARNVEAIARFHHLGFRILGFVEMCMELRPGGGTRWIPGPEILGCAFDY